MLMGPARQKPAGMGKGEEKASEGVRVLEVRWLVHGGKLMSILDTHWVLEVTPGGGVLSEVPSGPSLHTCAPCALPPLITPLSHRFYQIIWTD